MTVRGSERTASISTRRSGAGAWQKAMSTSSSHVAVRPRGNGRSWKDSSASGCASANAANSSGALIVGGGPTNPISRTPRSLRDRARALRAAACSLATAARAFGKNASPAAVRLTPRAWRSSSATPSSDSSWRIACVSAG